MNNGQDHEQVSVVRLRAVDVRGNPGEGEEVDHGLTSEAFCCPLFQASRMWSIWCLKYALLISMYMVMNDGEHLLPSIACSRWQVSQSVIAEWWNGLELRV